MNGWSSHLGGTSWDDEPGWLYEITWEWDRLPDRSRPGGLQAVHVPVYDATPGVDAHGVGVTPVGPAPAGPSWPGAAPAGPSWPAGDDEPAFRYAHTPAQDGAPDVGSGPHADVPQYPRRSPAGPREEPSWPPSAPMPDEWATRRAGRPREGSAYYGSPVGPPHPRSPQPDPWQPAPPPTPHRSLSPPPSEAGFEDGRPVWSSFERTRPIPQEVHSQFREAPPPVQAMPPPFYGVAQPTLRDARPRSARAPAPPGDTSPRPRPFLDDAPPREFRTGAALPAPAVPQSPVPVPAPPQPTAAPGSPWSAPPPDPYRAAAPVPPYGDGHTYPPDDTPTEVQLRLPQVAWSTAPAAAPPTTPAWEAPDAAPATTRIGPGVTRWEPDDEPVTAPPAYGVEPVTAPPAMDYDHPPARPATAWAMAAFVQAWSTPALVTPVSAPPTSAPHTSTTPISPTPISPTPTSATPISSTPISPTSTSARPVSPTPTSARPVSPTPTSARPVSPTPTSATPVSPTPSSARPISPTPAAATPVSPTPAAATPVSPTPTSATPVSPTPSSARPISPTPAAATPWSAAPVSPSTWPTRPDHVATGGDQAADGAAAGVADTAEDEGEHGLGWQLQMSGLGAVTVVPGDRPAVVRRPGAPAAEADAPVPQTAGPMSPVLGAEPESTEPEGDQAPASPGAAFARQPGHHGERAPSRLADPEQILAAYTWRLCPETLREVIDRPDDLLALRDRLTDRLEYAERDAVRARLLSLRAVASRLLNDLDVALADGRRALAHAEATGEPATTAIARVRLAQVLRWRGEYAEADRLFEEADSAELPNPLRAEVHELAGRSAVEQGRYLEAVNRFERALELRPDDDGAMVSRIELALDTITARTRQKGWGPYPRTTEEILHPPAGEVVPRNGHAPARPSTDGPAPGSRGGADGVRDRLEAAVTRERELVPTGTRPVL